jgi:hypothetical protein
VSGDGRWVQGKLGPLTAHRSGGRQSLPMKPFCPFQAIVLKRSTIRFLGQAPKQARWSAEPLVQFVTGTYCYQLGYAQMTSPVNIVIYAFGAFMLFALAIGFFAAPV